MKSQSTTKGFAILSLATILIKIISLIYIPFLTYIITKEGYGVYSSTYVVFTFIYVISNSGISVAISKIISEFIAIKDYRDAVRSFKIARFIMIIIGFTMSIIMILLSEPLASLVNFPKAALALKILSPTIMITCVLSVYRGYFQGRGNMTPTAISQIIEQIFNTVFSLAFAAWWIKYGLAEGIAGGTIGTSLGALVALLYIIKVYEKNKVFKVPIDILKNNKPKHNFKELLYKIFKYAIPITICLGLQNAGNLVDMANVKGRLLASGFKEGRGSELFGILTNFNILINTPIAFISALSVAVLPGLSTVAALKEKVLIEKKINYSFKLCLLVAVPCAVGLCILSKPIYQLIFSTSIEGYKLMLYGSIVVILWGIVQIQTTILQSLGKMYVVTFYIMIGIIGKIITNYILVGLPKINIMGAVVGSAISFLIPLKLNTRFINKSLGIKTKVYRQILKPLIASVFMAIGAKVTYYILYLFNLQINRPRIMNAISLSVSIVVSIYIYLTIMILIKGIGREDILSISPKLLKIIPKGLRKRMK